MNGDAVEAVWNRMERREEIAQKEAGRIVEVKAMGFVPEEVGPMVPEAPARGPVRMFETISAFPKGEDQFEYKPGGYRGRKTLQRADSFDVMAAKAARHKKPSPFSPAQIEMGRQYRRLFDDTEGRGMCCSSLEGRSGNGGDGTGIMDAFIDDRRSLESLRRRIGSGSAMVVRRIRPSDRGTKASIMDRRLVDIVCLEDGSITDVLRAHGWVREGATAQSKHIKALQVALQRALDRMMGPVRGGSRRAKTFGDQVLPDHLFVDERGRVQSAAGKSP